jgi:acyl-CoA reductase-like NAD-dependent aldehyde dehydrogenase
MAKAELMLIGGELVAGESNEWLESINPADETPLGRVPLANARDADKAVAAAVAAAPAWAATTPTERESYMREFARRINDLSSDFLEVEVRDTGNTIKPMRGDVRIAVDSLHYYGGLAHELKGETIPATSENLHITLREPFGPVLRITPFNHPLMFAVSKTAAALAAGNPVIVKPSETSPLSTALLATVARDVFPKGVFNIVTGLGTTVGDALVRHPDVWRIGFTGSVPTGMAIQRAAAEVAVKRLTLELGGKNPLIAFADADPGEVAAAAVRGMNFSWQGQSCGSTSRLMLHEDIHDEVLARIEAIVASLRLGDPLSDDTDMGPVNSAGHYKRVISMIEVAKEDGARLVTGGGRPEGSDFKRGFWVQPTVFAGVKPDMRIARQEVFGPVLSVLKWSSYDEAIGIANSVEYGLTASIFTKDVKQAIRAAKAVQSGFVWINGTSRHFTGVPFGGYKNSGLGNEEGIEELLSYTQTKAISFMM